MVGGAGMTGRLPAHKSTSGLLSDWCATAPLRAFSHAQIDRFARVLHTLKDLERAEEQAARKIITDIGGTPDQLDWPEAQVR